MGDEPEAPEAGGLGHGVSWSPPGALRRAALRAVERVPEPAEVLAGPRACFRARLLGGEAPDFRAGRRLRVARPAGAADTRDARPRRSRCRAREQRRTGEAGSQDLQCLATRRGL